MVGSVCQAHENQNEMLEIMAHHTLRKILCKIQESPFCALMVDETTDVSNKEQLTLVIRRVDERFDVYEEFLGMYNLVRTDAKSIISAILDALLRFQVPVAKIRGQCCSTMAGTRGGLPRCKKSSQGQFLPIAMAMHSI